MKKYHKLTSSLEDSLVNHLVRPGSAEARKITVTSSRKWLDLLKKSDPVGLLGRMLLGSSTWHSTHCLLTWKVKTTPQNRLLFQLAASVPHIDDTEYLWSPTPMAMDGQMTCLDKSPRGGLRSEKAIEELGTGDCWINPQYAEWLMGFPPNWTKVD